MADRFFVYRLVKVPGVGGLDPRQMSKKISGGAAMVNDWYLGSVDEADVDVLNEMSQFSITPCSAQVADGMKVYGIESGVTEDHEGNVITLTAQQLEDQAAAVKFMKKLAVRGKIAASNGDVLDLLSDISRRQSLIEQALVAIFDKVENSVAVPADVAAYLADAKASRGTTLKDVTDVNGKTFAENWAEVKARSLQVADILGDDYYA